MINFIFGWLCFVVWSNFLPSGVDHYVVCYNILFGWLSGGDSTAFAYYRVYVWDPRLRPPLCAKMASAQSIERAAAAAGAAAAAAADNMRLRIYRRIKILTGPE